MQADASAQTLLHRVRGGQRLFCARIIPEAVIPRDSMITLKGKNLVILDEEKLKTFSGFNANYLHLAERTVRRKRAP